MKYCHIQRGIRLYAVEIHVNSSDLVKEIMSWELPLYFEAVLTNICYLLRNQFESMASKQN